MFTREISVEGCLFLLFALGLFLVLNVPLQNLLGRVFRMHDKAITIVELCLFLTTAGILTRLATPVVNGVLESGAVSSMDLLRGLFLR